MGLTPPQFDVMAELGGTPGMTCVELSQSTLLAKASLTGIIDRLEAKGLIERQVVPNDRRATHRIEGVVDDTARKVQETTEILRDAVVKPLEPLVHIAAFLKGIRRGIGVYNRLRGFEPRSRATEASREDDEHLFI